MAPVSLTRAAVVSHLFRIEVPMCRTSQFARCFLSVQDRMWIELSCEVFYSGTCMILRERLIVRGFHELAFLFSAAQVLVWLF